MKALYPENIAGAPLPGRRGVQKGPLPVSSAVSEIPG